MNKEYFFLIYLICIMIISGVIKDHNLFVNLYEIIIDKMKSKKSVIFLIACIGGVLPIPGRVVVSASILDTMIDKTSPNRGKYGIVDFLSTHHYYWWSPLEKTVAIPMTVLGLSYIQFMSYAWVPLLISLLFVFYYVFIYIDDKEIVIVKPEHINNSKGVFVSAAPLLISILLMCFNVEPYFIFPFTTILYLLMTRTYNIRKIISYVNWELIFIVAVIIGLSQYLIRYSCYIISYLESLSETLNINSFIGFAIISIIAFTITFILGSSAKYASIVTILCSIFGLEYMTYFLTLEFSAYILSPMHKCVLISSKYFNTSLKDYYKILALWSVILISYGLISILSN